MENSYTLIFIARENTAVRRKLARALCKNEPMLSGCTCCDKLVKREDVRRPRRRWGKFL